ncbi:hypothetical protein D7V82_20770 [bacterium 1xD8-6]|nr:hypothetical protein D7V72_20625 [bacterium D16-36]RKI63251.1 hypothetical protein D7V82_20770 [bacterium 1xD8-6]
MDIDVSRYQMTEEDHKKLQEFKKNGNKYLEKEGKEIQAFMWTDRFAAALQAFQLIMGKLDFSKPFRVIVDYDPEQKRTLITQYAPEYPEEIKRLL